MKIILMIFAVVMSVATTKYAEAHHSFAATYNVDKEIVIKGKMVAFLYRNPHVVVHVNVKDENGNNQRWTVEWGAATTLRRQKIKRDTLRPGDEVVIKGSPGRNPGDHRLRMLSITRPADGWEWSGEFK